MEQYEIVVVLHMFVACHAVTYPENFCGLISARFFWGGRGGGRGGCDASWWGPGGKAPRSFQGFSTLKSLLIKIYPPQLVMKLIPHIFFNNLAKIRV